MIATRFQEAKKHFIGQEEVRLKALSTYQLGAFETFPFHAQELFQPEGKRRIEAFLKKLPTQGQFLYYFKLEIPEPSYQITTTVRHAKASKQLKLPLAHSKRISEYLYLGKIARSSFGQRIKQHFGLGNATKTYALYLAKWMESFSLKLTFCYQKVEAPTQENYLVDLLEKVLHQELKPILGKGPQ